MKTGIRPLVIRSVIEIGIFSAVVNLLLLVPPLYLLQVYDRVLPSSSLSTLIYLSLIALGALAVLGLLEIARSLYAGRVASRLAVKLGPQAFVVAMNGARAGFGDVQPLRDLSVVRSFVASRALTFLFDLPFGPLFIAIMYLIHPLLFLITLGGGVVMVAIAILNQMATSRRDREASEALSGATNSAQTFARNFETVRALGMTDNAMERWGSLYGDSLNATDGVGRINGIFSGISRTVRMVLQLLILCGGAYLVLQQEITAGMIFASAIISGRALQPLDQIIGSWQQIIEAGRSWKRLSSLEGLADEERFELPAPKGRVSGENIVYYPPGADAATEPVIRRLSFIIEAGETVAMIGPSQAGKSTLARIIVGAIRPRSGVLRIDGADIATWDPDSLGKHLGYLSQEVELFPGTIAENIARFDPDAREEDVIAAARMAHVHDLILGQKSGYGTQIGPGGVRLSGGERQRIGLARAFYGDPRLIVLDEPNASLDNEGEAALESAMRKAKERGTTVIIITHRPTIASGCDRIMMLRAGQIELYGPTAEVLQRLQQGAGATQQPAPPTKPQPGNVTATFGNTIRAGGQT
ncbi:type I secretion system permease/ATPase [Mesorhizobium sp. CAU 1732]|uniref:type I secretion system permease/ATPase n=1 Tax=Mesorhizobium sp. CAU 1732 TaxID=3140358 RepID=UPI003260041F